MLCSFSFKGFFERKLQRIKTPSPLILVFLWLLNKWLVLQHPKVLANSINITELPHYCFYLPFISVQAQVCAVLLHAHRPISGRKKNSFFHSIPVILHRLKPKPIFIFPAFLFPIETDYCCKQLSFYFTEKFLRRGKEE